MLDLIDQIQIYIFSYNKEKFNLAFIALLDKISIWLNEGNIQEQTAFNQVLKAMLDSYEKKDYLLLADLLEFELKPLIACEKG